MDQRLGLVTSPYLTCHTCLEIPGLPIYHPLRMIQPRHFTSMAWRILRLKLKSRPVWRRLARVAQVGSVSPLLSTLLACFLRQPAITDIFSAVSGD